MVAKILLVDDEANLLSAFKRKFRKHFEMHSALGAAEALELLETSGPFSVVVSDLRMPGMDGIQFLGEVKKRAPDTVRIMLTGNASEHLAGNAVKEGYLFRFHTKPCPLEVLFKSIQDGVRVYEQSKPSPPQATPEPQHAP